jgi:hypothetical protein
MRALSGAPPRVPGLAPTLREQARRARRVRGLGAADRARILCVGLAVGYWWWRAARAAAAAPPAGE